MSEFSKCYDNVKGANDKFIKKVQEAQVKEDEDRAELEKFRAASQEEVTEEEKVEEEEVKEEEVEEEKVDEEETDEKKRKVAGAAMAYGVEDDKKKKDDKKKE
jgi:hypothetical protein